MNGPELHGKVAVVTGGGRGIGKAVASRLARRGASVLLNDLEPEVAERAAEEIEGDVASVAGDLTISTTPEELIACAVERWNRVDIIVNNAGFNWDGPLEQMTDEQFQAMLDIHVLAPFRLLRSVAPVLIAAAKEDRRRGREVFRKVVNVTSVAGTMGSPRQANYNAGKAAIVGLTKGLAKEWGEWRINVNAVAPGFIDTRLTGPHGGDEYATYGDERIPLGIPEDHRRTGSDSVPLGRPGTPEEVAGAIVFLCSDESNYVNGQVINVTGGLVFGMAS